MPSVYLVNDHAHDFSPARKYGQFVNITSGRVNVLKTHELFLEIVKKIEGSSPDDYLLICGHHMLNILCALAWLMKHGVVRILVYDSFNNRYIIRDLSIWDLARKQGKTIGELIDGWDSRTTPDGDGGTDGLYEEDSVSESGESEGC